MSFILDALRKSEHERQRNRAPGIADTRVPQKQNSRAIWIPLVALLAGLNLALLAVLWFMGGDNDSPVAAELSNTRPGAPALASPAQSATPAHRSAPVAQPDDTDTVANTRNLRAELEAPTAADDMQDPARFATISPPSAHTDSGDNDASTTAGSSNRMLTVTEAMLDGSLSITPLHLDIHVYSDKPRERFVFINTSRYGEGERISEGPTISAINKQGVILNYQGRDYLLARD